MRVLIIPSLEITENFASWRKYRRPKVISLEVCQRRRRFQQVARSFNKWHAWDDQWSDDEWAGGVDISYPELVVSVSAWSPDPCAIASTRLTLKYPRRDSETTGTARRQALGRTARHGQLTGISLEPRNPWPPACKYLKHCFRLKLENFRSLLETFFFGKVKI